MTKSPRIMLVDDDPDFLEMNKEILEAAGYEAICFSDPEAALLNMEKAKPDIVITDLMMESLHSGFSFSRRVKGDPRFGDVPVIIVTAASSRRGFDFKPHTPEELSAMCADAYFDKPVAPKTLLAKVEELLERRAEEDSR